MTDLCHWPVSTLNGTRKHPQRSSSSSLPLALGGLMLVSMLTFSVLLSRSSTTNADPATLHLRRLENPTEEVARLSLHTEIKMAAEPGATTLTIIIPFVNDDVPKLVGGVREWVALGEACSEETSGRVGLLFLNNGWPPADSESDAVSATLLENVIKSVDGVDSVLRCFSEVRTIYAKLTPAEDGYPEGPSYMFFKLFTSSELADEATAPYTHAFWMEWDVRPVRPRWVDALVTATAGADFWMKGSSYVGHAFDGTVLDRENWGWIGHLNGNALYKLHDAAFIEFQALVQEREPPGHYWKPFDIAMWKTLYSFPYSWHLYQAFAEKFTYTRAVRHLGFTTSPSDEAPLRADPEVFLIHGNTVSAGTFKYTQKFAAGRPTSNSTILWADEVPAHRRVSVLMRTTLDNFEYAVVAVKSAKKHLPQALEYVVLVPAGDHAAAKKVFPAFVTLVADSLEDAYADKGVHQAVPLAMMHAQLLADTFCAGDFVFHLDADTVLTRTVTNKDVFLFNKAMVTYERYAVGEDAAHLRRWQAGATYSLGKEVVFDFDRTHEHMLPRAAYAAARTHLETHWNRNLSAYLNTRFGAYVEGHTPEEALFSAYVYLSSFTFAWRPDLASWNYVGADDDGGEHAVSRAYSVLRPALSCRVNTACFTGARPNPSLRAKLLIAFKGLADGAEGGSCAAANDIMNTYGCSVLGA